MTVTPKDVKVVQINVWLGSQQRVEILAHPKIRGIHLCRDPAPHGRTGLGSDPDVVHLVCQLGAKLCEALEGGDGTITIMTDGPRIEPDP